MGLVNPFRVRIDWAKDGTFGTTGIDNVTDYVRGNVTASYGRDVATAVSPIVAGRGSFQLDNADRRFSPFNAGSPIGANLKPARPVLLERIVGGVAYSILAGHTDTAPINPDVDSKTVTFTVVDYLGDFRTAPMATTLYQGMRTGELIDQTLTEIGWTGGRDLDDGATVVPYWWSTENAYDALQKLVASEGAPALLSIGPAGEVVFRDRTHRLIRSASTTVQATWRGTEGAVEPVMGKGFSWDAGWNGVLNDVSFSVDEREPDGALTAVWSTPETIHLGASASQTFIATTSDPFRDAVAPQDVFDFRTLSGSVASTSLSRTSGASTVITVTAGAGGAVVAGLQLRAYSIPVARTVGVRENDATSITDYGRRNLPPDAIPVWASRWDAVSLADLYVLQRKQPLATCQVSFVCADQQTTRLAAVLARDIGDRVRIVEPETQTNHDFFVESIAHNIDLRTGAHTVTFGCERAPSAPTNPFILNTSTLNGSAALGY